MSSAEGQVQHLGYQATFPLLLNVAGEPTYFMALKDAAGLVKQYAMVNITRYQNVAIGDTVEECERAYLELIGAEEMTANEIEEAFQVTGRIQSLTQIVLDGNSHYYVILEGNLRIFDIPVAQFPQIIRYSEGNSITLRYLDRGEGQTVVEIPES